MPSHRAITISISVRLHSRHCGRKIWTLKHCNIHAMLTDRTLRVRNLILHRTVSFHLPVKQIIIKFKMDSTVQPTVTNVTGKGCKCCVITAATVVVISLCTTLPILFILGTSSQEEPIVGLSVLPPLQLIDGLESSFYLLQNRGEATEDFQANIDYAELYKQSLAPYEDITQTYDCSSEIPQEVESGQGSCRFDGYTLGDCLRFPYGYQLEDGEADNPRAQIKPCFLLKFTPPLDWTPGR